MIGRKSTPATAEPFRVPSLAEVDTGYAALLEKQIELTTRRGALESEKRALDKAIASDPSRETRPEIAALLGDEPGTKSLNRRRVAEIRKEIADIEAAHIVLRQRLADARGRASTAVVAASRHEYARRVKGMIDAMRALDAAHREYDELRFQFELEDVSWASLIPMSPTFLGDANEPDRRIVRFIREAEAAGYAG